MSAKGIGTLTYNAAKARIADWDESGNTIVSVFVNPVSSLGNRWITEDTLHGTDSYSDIFVTHQNTSHLKANGHAWAIEDLTLLANKSVEFDFSTDPFEIPREKIPDNDIQYLEVHIDIDKRILELWSLGGDLTLQQVSDFLDETMVGRKLYEPILDIPENSVFRVKKITISNQPGVAI